MAKAHSNPQLTAEVLRFVHQQSAEGRIRAMILDLVNQALRVQSIQLSNEEKDSLAHAVMREVLLEMLKEYQGVSNQN